MIRKTLLTLLCGSVTILGYLYWAQADNFRHHIEAYRAYATDAAVGVAMVRASDEFHAEALKCMRLRKELLLLDCFDAALNEDAAAYERGMTIAATAADGFAKAFGKPEFHAERWRALTEKGLLLGEKHFLTVLRIDTLEDAVANTCRQTAFLPCPWMDSPSDGHGKTAKQRRKIHQEGVAKTRWELAYPRETALWLQATATAVHDGIKPPRHPYLIERDNQPFPPDLRGEDVRTPRSDANP